MKKYLFAFLFAFFSLLPAHAVKKIEANPINIAVMLTQETDTAKIASTLRYYGYTAVTHTARSTYTEPHTPILRAQHADTDDYIVYFHPNGSVIRYKYTESDQKHPTIEVTSKASQKEKDQTLQSLNFQKNGNFYVRKSVGYTTYCASGSHGTLILTRHGK